MITYLQRHTPSVVLPDQLDKYLEAGWYRLGSFMFTTHFLILNQEWYSAIWLRLHLPTHVYSKNQRKMLRQYRSLFEITYGIMNLNEEKQALYNQYRGAFKGVLPLQLKDSLQGGDSHHNRFNTWEVTIRYQGKLIACSFFDVGSTTMASIQGIYDPKYNKYSLGYFTMLLEIEYALHLNLTHFYPGYVVPGSDRFEYKKRIGATEYFDLQQGAWLPSKAYDFTTPPINKMVYKLQQIKLFLKQNGIPAPLVYYGYMEARLYYTDNIPFLDSPCFLALKLRSNIDTTFIIQYNIIESIVEVIECQSIESNNNTQENKIQTLANGKQRYGDILSVMHIVGIFTELNDEFKDLCRHIQLNV